MRSLDAIRQFVPEQYRSVCDAMGDLAVQLQIDHERFTLQARAGQVLMGRAFEAAAVRLRVASSTIVSLIDGQLELLVSILDDAIALYGSVAQLTRFDDALMAYLHGAVRSPRQSEILREFRMVSERRSAGER